MRLRVRTSGQKKHTPIYHIGIFRKLKLYEFSSKKERRKDSSALVPLLPSLKLIDYFRSGHFDFCEKQKFVIVTQNSQRKYGLYKYL